jgi:hypothetical protein
MKKTIDWTWEDEMNDCANNFEDFVKPGDIEIRANNSRWKCILKLRNKYPVWVNISSNNI